MSNWIPVKERLPDYRERVLVSLRDKDPHYDYCQIGVAFREIRYLPRASCKLGWTFEDYNEHYQLTDECVLAWQPLPEPYQEEI